MAIEQLKKLEFTTLFVNWGVRLSTNQKVWTSEDGNSKKVLRGGAWGSYPESCPSANRIYCLRSFGNNNTGFRVMCVR